MYVVGTAGHVDHGKSSLVEALTGMDPDRFEEEKRRGLTIDLGFAWCTLPSGRVVGIVDVPGHERFIRNMLAGVGGIAAAIFVVAADEGWMPQSAEHLQILDFLDVRAGVVALTKTDLVDDEIAGLAADEVDKHLEGTSMAGAPMVPVSAKSGTGLDDLLAALDGVLDTVPRAGDRGRPRLYVDRSFTIAGSGTVVTGTLTGGRLHTTDEVTVLPAGHTGRVRALQTHKQTLELAEPGSRVAVNLAGFDRRAVRRGDALVVGDWRATDHLAGRLRAARDLTRPMPASGAYALFTGSADTLCRLRFLEHRPSQTLRAGESVLVDVYCDRQLPLAYGDRFVVRDVGRFETVAGGVVLDAHPGPIRRDDPAAVQRLERREVAGDRLVPILVAEHGLVARGELEPSTGLGTEDIRVQIEASDVVATANYVLDPGHEARLRGAAVERLAACHAAEPLAPGLNMEELRHHLHLDAEPFVELLALWETAGALVREGVSVRLPMHRLELDETQRAAADRSLETLRAAGASPPDPASVGLGTQLAKALERRGELVIVATDLVYPADVWHRIEQAVVDHITRNGPATVAQVRDAVGTTRKYAVPVLEHLDATGVTRRRGDLRELGPRGQELTG